MSAVLTDARAEAIKARVRKKRRQEAEQQLEVREYLRHEIAARTHVQDLETIALMLFSGREAITEPVTEQVTTVPLDNDRTRQLIGAANVKQALLKKVLPDIKSVELTGAGGEDLGESKAMAELELRNRLRAILTGQSLDVIEGIAQPLPAPEVPVYDCLR